MTALLTTPIVLELVQTVWNRLHALVSQHYADQNNRDDDSRSRRAHPGMSPPWERGFGTMHPLDMMARLAAPAPRISIPAANLSTLLDPHDTIPTWTAIGPLNAVLTHDRIDDMLKDALRIQFQQRTERPSLADLHAHAAFSDTPLDVLIRLLPNLPYAPHGWCRIAALLTNPIVLAAGPEITIQIGTETSPLPPLSESEQATITAILALGLGREKPAQSPVVDTKPLQARVLAVLPTLPRRAREAFAAAAAEEAQGTFMPHNSTGEELLRVARKSTTHLDAQTRALLLDNMHSALNLPKPAPLPSKPQAIIAAIGGLDEAGRKAVIKALMSAL